LLIHTHDSPSNHFPIPLAYKTLTSDNSILPALAFSLDMFVKTYHSYGVNEVLLASVLGCIVFALLAAQPLVIVGVTGPITVFSYTVYDIVVPNGTNFFAFMAWIGIWSSSCTGAWPSRTHAMA